MDTRFQQTYGPWALIAGASVGLGAEFSRQLAERGLNLLLVARNAAALDDLAAQIRNTSNVEVITASLDLGRHDLEEHARAMIGDREIGLLVYNAAAAHVGPFLEQSLESKLKSVDVNCRGPVILAHLLAPAMAARGRGGLLLMSSLAATQGSPLVSVYASTKAFDLVLAEGLWYELAPKGVDVLACRAGATRTPAYESSNPAPGPSPVMEPAPVVREALDALGKTPSMIPGAFNKLASFFLNRVLPRRTAIRTMGDATGKMYGKK